MMSSAIVLDMARIERKKDLSRYLIEAMLELSS